MSVSYKLRSRGRVAGGDPDEDATSSVASSKTKRRKKATSRQLEGQEDNEKDSPADNPGINESEEKENNRSSIAGPSDSSTAAVAPEETKNDKEKLSEEESDETDDDDGKPAAKSTTPVDAAAEEEEEERSKSGDDKEIFVWSDIAGILSDLIMYKQEMIFHFPNKRDTNFEAMMYFWNQHPYKHIPFGRLHNRNSCVEILMKSCKAPPYGYSNSGVNVSGEGGEKEQFMVSWEKKDWDDLIFLFDQLRKDCMRKDANILVNEHTQPNEEPRKKLLKAEQIKKLYKCIIVACECNKALSPIRLHLESKKLTNGEETTFSKEQYAEVLTIRDELQHKSSKKIIGTLFEDTDESSTSRLPVLKNNVKEMLKMKPWNLYWLQEKIETLVVTKWVPIVFDNCVPRLFKLRYRFTQEEEEMHLTANEGQSSVHATLQETNATLAAVSKLNQNRNLLTGAHGDDPIEESRQIASQVTGVARKRTPGSVSEESDSGQKRARTANFYEKKKSAQQIVFDSENEEDIDDDDDDENNNEDTQNYPERQRVSLPTPNRSYRIVPVDFKGPGPIDGRYSETGHVNYRLKWTDEEVNALKLGVEMFGPGKWVEIKKRFAEVLRNRNNIQLKDKYRTMLRLGEI